MKFASLWVWLVGALALSACHTKKATPVSHVQLGEDAEPLRSAFNADLGRVRVVMLVAPT